MKKVITSEFSCPPDGKYNSESDSVFFLDEGIKTNDENGNKICSVSWENLNNLSQTRNLALGSLALNALVCSLLLFKLAK